MPSHNAVKLVQIMGSGKDGGAESHFAKIVAALHHGGIPQIAIIKHHEKRRQFLEDAGVQVVELPFNGPFDKVTNKGIKTAIKEFEPEIVQSWMYEAARATPASNDYLSVGWLRGYQHLRDYRRCDHLIGMTGGIVSSIVEQGWAADRIHHIRPSAEEFTAAAEDRSIHDTPANATLILCLGRLHWHKGFDTMIMAMPHLPEVYLWVAGDGDEYDNLRELAEQAGVADRVKLLGWRTNKAELFAAADMIVVPSRYEPFGLVMIEAWANKKPLVVTKAAGPRATVQDEVDALLVPIDDVDALSSTIRKVLDDQELRNYIVEHGYTHYQRDYTMDAVLAQYNQFYKEILEIGPLAKRGISALSELQDKIYYLIHPN